MTPRVGSGRIKADSAEPRLTVIHCHWVNSSQFAGPPMLVPLPDAPTPSNGLPTSSLTV